MFKARAKSELREEATKQDAMDVVDIMKYCLIDILSDNSMETDFPQPQRGLKSTSRNQVQSF